MTNEVREIIHGEVFCRCGQCEAAVQDVLRIEAMLCRGAKNILTRRRKEIGRARRRPYFQRRYVEGREQ